MRYERTFCLPGRKTLHDGGTALDDGGTALHDGRKALHDGRKAPDARGKTLHDGEISDDGGIGIVAFLWLGKEELTN